MLIAFDCNCNYYPRGSGKPEANKMGKSLETPKGAVWALFLTAHAVLVGEIERRLARAGLPALAWYDVLWALERAGDRRLRMRELAELTVISRSKLKRPRDRVAVGGLG